MFKHVLTATALCSAFAIAGCEDTNQTDGDTNPAEQANETTPNEAMSTLVSMYEDLGSTLEGVTDQESAQEAVEELNDLNQRVSDNSGQMSALEDLTDAQETELRNEYATQLDEAKNTVQEQLDRLERENPALRQTVQGAVEQVQSKLDNYSL